jgi:hypothetical protein
VCLKFDLSELPEVPFRKLSPSENIIGPKYSRSAELNSTGFGWIHLNLRKSHWIQLDSVGFG